MASLDIRSEDARRWPTIPPVWTSRGVAIGIAIVLVAIVTFTTAPDSIASALLLDRQQYSIFPFP